MTAKGNHGSVTTRTEPRVLAERYALGAMIGAGGMGEVFEARDLRLDRQVAVKLLRSDPSIRPREVARLKAEARLASRVHHANVVEVLDAGVDAQPFVVMERLSGRTLRERLDAGRLDEREVRELGRQILAGLAAIHDASVAHRDVKPGNILEGGGGRWKVGDFGIATSLASDHTLAAPGEVLGSMPYVAPERLRGEPTTLATDVYAVGTVLYEALAGARAFHDDDPELMALHIREGSRPPLAELRPDADPALVGAIERAMSVDPADRFASAGAFAGALEPAGSDTTVVVPPPIPTAPLPVAPSATPTTPVRRAPPAPASPASARSRPGRTFVGVAALVVVLLASLLVWAAATPDRAPTTISPSLGPTTQAPATSSPSPSAATSPSPAGDEGSHEGNANGHDEDHGNGEENGNGPNGNANGHD